MGTTTCLDGPARTDYTGLVREGPTTTGRNSVTRRTREQIATDRSTLLESITPLWARLPEANTSDLQALVRQGLIERDVRREWDRQSGNGSMFGGAGVVQRHRAYYVTDPDGYEDRWCYHNAEAAITAASVWDGTGDPDGWHRHPRTGRRRPDGDPTKEYVAP